MADTATLSKKQINEQLAEIDRKLEYKHFETALTLGRELYAKASSDPSVQLTMKNLDEINQRIDTVLTCLDESFKKYNWDQIYSYIKEIKILDSDSRVKRVIFLKIKSNLEQYNSITAESLDQIMFNDWPEADKRIKELEKMDPKGSRSKQIRAFYEIFKCCIGMASKDLDYKIQQELKRLFERYEYYRRSDKSPVFVLWNIDKI